MAHMPNVPETLKVDLVYSDATGTFGSRVFEQYFGTAPDDAQLTTYAGQVATAWSSHMAAVTNENIALTAVNVEDLTSPTNANGAWAGSHAGSESASEALPNNVSFDIQFKIPVRYRGGHGVIHLPGQLASDLATQRQWDPTRAATILAAFEAFIASVSSPGGVLGTMNHSVVRGYRNPSPGIDIEPVTAYAARLTVGTMRKRARALR